MIREGSVEDGQPLRGRWLRYFLNAIRWVLSLTVGWYVMSVSCEPRSWSSRYPGKGKVATAKTQINIFLTALDLYQLDNRRLPTKQQGLNALVAPPIVPPRSGEWRGLYLKDVTQIPLDPWGNPYVYQPDAKEPTLFLITSYGKDGLPGGTGEAADLTSDPPQRW